jgi:hypothetical protein
VVSWRSVGRAGGMPLERFVLSVTVSKPKCVRRSFCGGGCWSVGGFCGARSEEERDLHGWVGRRRADLRGLEDVSSRRFFAIVQLGFGMAGWTLKSRCKIRRGFGSQLQHASASTNPRNLSSNHHHQ